MSLFDALSTAQQAMSVHRFRTEIAADNLANIYTPGYQRKVVDLAATTSSHSPVHGGGSRGAVDAHAGAVSVHGVHADRVAGSARDQTMLGVADMMRAKSAFELNARVATMLKSMITATLEIGRGG